MPTKKIEGVELANYILLNRIANFLALKKFYGKDLSEEEQMKKAKFDISKRGKLYKMLENAGIRTEFDMAINSAKANFNELTFGDYAKIMQTYRAQVIRKWFSHRKDDCK